MKRITIKLLLLLLAGAIINVAVAWGCEYFDHGPEALLPFQRLSIPTRGQV